MIVSSGEGGNFKLISGKELVGLINVVMAIGPVLVDVVLDFIHVDIGHPAVNIHDSEEKIFGGEIEVFEFGLHLLSTPTYIGTFALVLVFPELMEGIVDAFKLGGKLIDKFLGFDICPFLMFFHPQKYEIGLFCSFMDGKYIERFSQYFYILFVVGDDDCLENGFVFGVSFLRVWACCSSQYSPVLVQQVKTDQGKQRKLDTGDYDQWKTQ